MNKEIANRLKQKTLEVAEYFSNQNRARNYNNEGFRVDNIVPLSETTALVTFQKSSGKFAVAFFYFINVNEGEWRYFFPTDSHILGMKKVEDLLWVIEKVNFPMNEKC